MASARPRPPFAGWPIQWEMPDGFVWVVPEPLTLVSQSCTEVASVGAVERLHDVLDEIVGLGILNARTELVAIHDLRSIRSVESGIREAWLRRAKRPGNPFSIATANYAAIGNSVVKVALQLSALGLQVKLGQPGARFVDDPAPVLERHRVGTPPADFLAKVRRAGP